MFHYTLSIQMDPRYIGIKVLFTSQRSFFVALFVNKKNHKINSHINWICHADEYLCSWINVKCKLHTIIYAVVETCKSFDTKMKREKKKKKKMQQTNWMTLFCFHLLNLQQSFLLSPSLSLSLSVLSVWPFWGLCSVHAIKVYSRFIHVNKKLSLSKSDVVNVLKIEVNKQDV